MLVEPGEFPMWSVKGGKEMQPKKDNVDEIEALEEVFEADSVGALMNTFMIEHLLLSMNWMG